MLTVVSMSGDLQGRHDSYFNDSKPEMKLNDMKADKSSGPRARYTSFN